MAEVVVYARADVAQNGITKLRAAGCSVTLRDATRKGVLKDSDVHRAGVVVADVEFATRDFMNRMQQFTTPTVVVGTRIKWDKCLRPVIAAMRQARGLSDGTEPLQ